MLCLFHRWSIRAWGTCAEYLTELYRGIQFGIAWTLDIPGRSPDALTLSVQAGVRLFLVVVRKCGNSLKAPIQTSFKRSPGVQTIL